MRRKITSNYSFLVKWYALYFIVNLGYVVGVSVNLKRRPEPNSPSDSQSTAAMVKILNSGQEYNFLNWGVYQSSGAYCANDSGSIGEACKATLMPGELQTTNLLSGYDSATYTYGINNRAYNIKISPQASGLLDSNNNIVSTVDDCTATNSFPSGYTLISINCDSLPIPNYDATVYLTGVKKRGVNFSGEEWQSGSYHPSSDDCNKVKSIGFNSGRYPISITKLSNDEGIIDWSEGEAAVVDSSLKILLACGMQEVILDVHNTLIGPTGKADWSMGVITGEQLLTFWQQTAPRYQDYPSFSIGVVNEPHDISENPNDPETEANALWTIYKPIVIWLAGKGITRRSYWEPSNYGAISNYANPVWQKFYSDLVDLSAYPDTMVADGHAYGTNPDGPGGSGYGDCAADGVAHNNLQEVADFLMQGNYLGAVTEYNGDPSYPNCINFVQKTVAFMNAHAQNSSGGFISNYLWAYYLNQGSTDPLDINSDGKPQNNAQILAMQGYGDLLPGKLTGNPTAAPATPASTISPTTAIPSASLTGGPTDAKLVVEVNKSAERTLLSRYIYPGLTAAALLGVGYFGYRAHQHQRRLSDCRVYSPVLADAVVTPT